MFYVLPIFAAMLLVCADRISKWLVNNNMYIGQSIDVIPGFARLYYIRNNGAAFGMLGGGRWLFVLFAVIAAIAVAWFYVVWPRGRRFVPARILLVVIISGIAGNAFDRAVSGDVIDFIDFTFVRFAIFNIADICITCGAFALVLFSLFGGFNGISVITGKPLASANVNGDIIDKEKANKEGDAESDGTCLCGDDDDGRGDRQ